MFPTFSTLHLSIINLRRLYHYHTNVPKRKLSFIIILQIILSYLTKDLECYHVGALCLLGSSAQSVGNLPITLGTEPHLYILMDVTVRPFYLFHN